mgnify:CR=1 FL=1|jgi:glycerate 2-kinase
MRILIAPDKFKGSLKAAEAATAIRDGFSRVFPHANFELIPIADGGEGTATLFLDSMQGEEVRSPAHDALGRAISATYGWFSKTKTAVIEMSEASGLWRLHPSEHDPLQTTTFGTGELIRDARERGARKILVALGGSATNDAGVGMAEALGWKFLDASENEMAPRVGNFSKIQRLIPPPPSGQCEITALCDVVNPLLGPLGATHVYSVQKGATPAMIQNLEMGLTHLADLCHQQLHGDHRNVPGAGAAGGLGFGLLTFCDAQIEPGFQAVSKMLGLSQKIISADLIITGEGRIDTQSEHGKGPVEVARLARTHGKPVIAFAGCIAGSTSAFDACIPIADGPISREDSEQRAAELLCDAAERSARLLSISL